MSLTSSIYNNLFKRTSTFTLAAIGSVFFFERTFDLVSDEIFNCINKGKLYKDLKTE